MDKGGVLFIPRGSVHPIAHFGTSDTRTLSVITPGLFGTDDCGELGEVVKGGGPADLRPVMAVMQRHGLRLAPRTT